MIVTQLKHLKESKDNANYVKQLAHHSLESDELTVFSNIFKPSLSREL